LKNYLNTLSVEDATKIRNLIYVAENNKKPILSQLQTMYFDFDKHTFEKFKTLQYKDILKQLTAISKKLTKPTKKIVNMPNILTACHGDSSICKGNKLLVPTDKLHNILEILAYDIINPTKWKWLFNSIFIERAVDFFNFIQRANETITVEIIN
jgi:hypothetical protein